MGLLTEPQRDKLGALTSLRFFAALLVFSWHCVPTRQFSGLFSLGYFGVSFFFLLSGFILTYSYHASFANGLQLGALRAFYAARIARLVPLHLVTMPPMFLTMALFAHPSWAHAGVRLRLTEVAAQAALVQSWFPLDFVHFGGNGPSWSISVEMFFYALFPVLAFVLLRTFRGSSARIALACAFALWLVQLVVLLPQQAVGDDWRFYVFPPARLADFAIGMLVAVAFLRRNEQARRPLSGTSVELLAVAAVLMSLYVSPVLPLALRYSAALVPAWGCIVYVLAARRGALSRILEHPALVRLGEVSFAFYLVHLVVIVTLTHTVGTGHPLFMVLAFGITLGLSFALFHAIEQPMRRRIRLALSGRERASALKREPRANGVDVVAPAGEQRGFHVQPSQAV